MKLSSKFMLSLVAVFATANVSNAMFDSMTSAFRNDPVEQKLISIAPFKDKKAMVDFLNQPEIANMEPESLSEEIAQTENALKRSKAMTQALKEQLSKLKSESNKRKK